MKKYFIKNEVFDANVFFIIGSDKAATSFLNKIDTHRKEPWVIENDPDVEGYYYHLERYNAKFKTRRVIHLLKFDRSRQSISVLAHEILHYVNDVCLTKGIKHEAGEEETSAYLMDYTLRECLKVLNYK